MAEFTFEEALGPPQAAAAPANEFTFEEALKLPEEPHGRFFLNLREGWRSSLPGIVQSHVQAGRNLEELANELELGVQAARTMGRPDIPEWGELGGAPKGSIFPSLNPFAGHSLEEAEQIRDAMRAEAARKLTEYQAKRGGEMREYEESPSFYEEPGFMGKVKGFFEAAGGQLLGSAPDPTNWIPVGRGATALRSFGRGAAVNAPAAAGIDVAAQEQEQNLGLREEFDPWRTAIGAAAGGAIGGGVTAAPQALRALRGLGTRETRPPTVEEALPTNFENQIVPADERPLAEIIAERVGMERQRGTDADVGARVKQRRADIAEAYRAAEREGGILRREDLGEEQPRPARDVTGTAYRDPAAYAAARDLDTPGLASAFDQARLAQRRAAGWAEAPPRLPEPPAERPVAEAQPLPLAERRAPLESMEMARAAERAPSESARAQAEATARMREGPPEPAPREPEALITPEQLSEIERMRRLQPPEPPEARPVRPARTQPIEATQPQEAGRAETVRGAEEQVPQRGPELRQGAGEGGQNLQFQAPRQAGGPALGAGRGVPQGARAPAQADARLSDPVKVETLRAMARNAGWAETGGRLLREEGAEGKVIGRTSWVPKEEWFGAMQRDRGTKMPAGKIPEMVERAVRGERLTPQEQRTLKFMLDENDRMASDFAEEGFDAPDTVDLIDNDLVTRARQIAGDEAIDNLPDAMEPADFMAAVRRIVDEGEQGRDVEAGIPQDRPEARLGEEPAVAEREAGGGRTEPVLESYTEADIRTREERVKAAEATEKKAQAEAETKAKADREREDFKLSGSDRPADSNPDQGTLYGGIPLAPIARGIAQAFGWTGPRASAYAKEVGAWWKSLADAAKNRRGPEGSPVKRMASLAFDTATGHMRSIAKQYQSKTLDWVIDQFDARAGKSDRAVGQTFNDAVDETVNKYARKLSQALGTLTDDKSAMSQVAALVRNPQNIRRGTKIGDAAYAVRQMLDEALAYMKAAGVDVGEVKGGYYPREFDLARVMKDPQGFIQGAAQAYREGGMDAKGALEAAKVLSDHVIHGGFDTIFRPDKGNIRSPFVKGRVFGKQVDAATHPLNKFLVDDPAMNLSLYITRMARRAETAKRFGDGFSHWDGYYKPEDLTPSGAPKRGAVKQRGISEKIIEEGGAGALEALKDYIAIGAGLRRQGATQGLKAASWIRTWTTLGLLEKATLSSLQEFLVPAIRSGNWADAGRSLRGTLRALTKTAKGREMRELAEDLNMIADSIHDTVNAARYSGGEPVGLLQSQIMDKFFKRTGLHQWTEASIVGSLDVGRVFIRRMAKRAQAGEKLARNALVELGIAEKDIPAFAKGLLSANDGLPMAGEIKGGWGDQYRVAMRRFSQQSIMRPHATDRPKWASTPWGSVVFQLQSYNYAFYENVIKRVARMTKEAATGKGYTTQERMQLLMPLATLPLLYGLGMGIGEMRDAVLGDPSRKKQEGWQKALKAQSRAVPIAPIDPFINLFSQARYDASASRVLAGPALGTLGKAVDVALAQAFNDSEKTNTAERASMRAIYDLILEPGVNFALAGFQFGKIVPPLAAAATQAVGAGSTREAFVSGTAGPKIEKKSRADEFSY